MPLPSPLFTGPFAAYSNDGSSQRSWKTIAYALCGGDYGCPCSEKNPNAPDSLDTLFIREGRYHEHHIIVRNYGGQVDWLTGDSGAMHDTIVNNIVCANHYNALSIWPYVADTAHSPVAGNDKIKPPISPPLRIRASGARVRVDFQSPSSLSPAHAAAAITMRVMDIRGRIVSELAVRPLSGNAATVSVVWNRRDAAGAYFILVSEAKRRYTATVPPL